MKSVVRLSCAFSRNTSKQDPGHTQHPDPTSQPQRLAYQSYLQREVQQLNCKVDVKIGCALRSCAQGCQPLGDFAAQLLPTALAFSRERLTPPDRSRATSFHDAEASNSSAVVEISEDAAGILPSIKAAAESAGHPVQGVLRRAAAFYLVQSSCPRLTVLVATAQMQA